MIKILNVIAIIVLCCLNSLNAQDTIQKKNIYRTWVSLNSEPFEIKTVFYEIKDSSIWVSNSVEIQDYASGRFEVTELHIKNIERIETRRNNNIGKGAIIGALTGFTVGGIIGLASGNKRI